MLKSDRCNQKCKKRSPPSLSLLSCTARFCCIVIVLWFFSKFINNRYRRLKRISSLHAICKRRLKKHILNGFSFYLYKQKWVWVCLSLHYPEPARQPVISVVNFFSIAYKAISPLAFAYTKPLHTKLWCYELILDFNRRKRLCPITLALRKNISSTWPWNYSR